MEHETKVAAVKVGLSWLGAGAALQLSDYASVAAIVTSIVVTVYTALQLYVLVRDKIIRDRP